MRVVDVARWIDRNEPHRAQQADKLRKRWHQRDRVLRRAGVKRRQPPPSCASGRLEGQVTTVTVQQVGGGICDVSRHDRPHGMSQN